MSERSSEAAAEHAIHGDDTSPAEASPPLDRHLDALRQHFPLPDLEQLRQQAAERARRRQRRTPLAALAVMTLAAALWWIDPAYDRATYSADAEAPRTVQLADGTHVTLDAETALRVSFHLRSRRAQLEHGRVLLEVAHATYRPFMLQADRAEVHVLGTRFEARRQGHDVSVYLDEGSVDVRLATPHAGEADHYQLVPGNLLQISATHAAQLLAQKAPLDWARTELVFTRTPLAEVLQALQKHAEHPIRLTDPALGSLPISGVFRTDQLGDALAVLPLVAPVSVRTQSDGSVLVGRAAP